MKHRAHLNKYLIKYKWYLFWGTVFTIVSNLFGVIPAQVVRFALDLVQDNLAMYYVLEGMESQKQMYDSFAWAVGLFGALILIMAILKGIFLFAFECIYLMKDRKKTIFPINSQAIL